MRRFFAPLVAVALLGALSWLGYASLQWYQLQTLPYCFDEQGAVVSGGGDCVVACESEAECDALARQVEGELEGLAEAYDQGSVGAVRSETPTDGQASFSSSYAVSAGETLALTGGEDTAEARSIWELIARIAPNTLSDPYIEQYATYLDPQSDVLAYVEDSDLNGKWSVVINLAGHRASTEQEQLATIVHELGHIVTLNTSQLDPTIPEEECPTAHPGEGCAREGSSILRFTRTFWSEQDIAAVGGFAGEGQGNLYSASPERFVTEYAATNPVEDLAESFTYFVLARELPVGSRVADEKIRSLAQDSYLAEVRGQMRANLVNELVRMRR